MIQRHGELQSGEFLAAVAFGAFLGFVAGGIAGAKIEAMTTRDRAISHDAAHYDPRTGEFVWDAPGMKEVKP